MKYFIFCCLAALCCSNVWGQRMTDRLDRGLVVVPTGSTSGSTTNMITWRRLAEEYYDVTYNLYKDGSLLVSGLTVPCYADNNRGYPTTQYQVAAVVNGTEQTKCTAMTAWTQYVYKLTERCPSGYLDVVLGQVMDRNGSDVTAHYLPNDAEFADLDGDGQLEMIIKRLNTTDANDLFPVSNTTEFDIIEAYDINWQTGAATRLWWIDVGPNMVSGGSHELNIIAYDWDEDGKAEVVLRGADNMIIHYNGGNRTIGDASVNTRNTVSHTANMTYTNTGSEFLIYMNGLTGQPYVVMDYPLARGSASDWGDSYGHRSSKYFFGAPVLDGRKASLFLARGIYTKEKMAAYDINPTSHTLTQRWTWECSSSNGWYGQGNHNFCIADVDEDGRDEIIYGSMVIDDNGQGLSTTGLGHGDALHCSDFDPFREGLEIFACNESSPAMNYRNATTSRFYFRQTGSDDDGRALCGNFSDIYPGACGRSTQTGMVSCVADQVIGELNGDSFINWGDLNFRIYWDGDLRSEVLNGAGTEGNAKIEKPGTGRLFTTDGCNMNNWTKNHPCFQGDLIGDWREELVLRCGSNVRIYTSGMYTSHNLYTLWHDHEYRQAMVWQMHAYNQPPHPSFFVGELEDITMAPPPLSLTDRTVVDAGSTVTSSCNNKVVQTYGYTNNSYNVTASISPKALIMNVPVWTQGHGDNGYITTMTYSHTLNFSGSGNLSGTARLVKQGKGVLNISNVTLTHSGNTDIWGGTVNFDGTLTNSKVWMNRFTTLNTNGGTFSCGLEMCYGATLNVGGPTAQTLSTVTTNGLTLNYGARVVLDINSTTASENDQLNMGTLTIGTKSWEYGPAYMAPVFYINAKNMLGVGRYPIGTIANNPSNLSAILIESNGNVAASATLEVSEGVLYLVIPEGAVPTMDMPTFSIKGMNPYNTYYFLPSVGFECQNASVTPTFTGTFTDMVGNVTQLGTVFYQADFETQSTNGWSTSVGGRFSPIIMEENGNYYLTVNQSERNNNGCVVTGTITQNAVSAGSDFTMTFDMKLSSSSNQSPTSFTLYDASNTNAILSLTATAAWSTEWIVNNSSLTVTLPNSNMAHSNESITNVTWCSYILERQGNTTYLTIKNRDTQAVILARTEITTLSSTGGLGKMTFGTSRYFANFAIDNLRVENSLNNPFTFTQPGTLRVTASGAGYADATASFEVTYPYAIYYESPAYNEIQAANVATTLGENLWDSTSGTTRWANWSKNNATYGAAYVYVAAKNNSGYVDQDSVITIARKSNSYPLTFLEGFGIGQNGTNATTISATNLGDATTVIYYKADTSWGNASSYDEGYTYAAADGSFSYQLTNNTFCKLIAYVPIHEEYDEASTTAPTGIGDGNVAILRTFSSITNGAGWNTLVLPFDMDEAQVVRTFGSGTQIARFTGSTPGTLIFTTDARTITANEPFLIRVGHLHTVAGKQFYVFTGIDRSITAEPTVETTYYDFIGSYVNSGKVTFPANTYFYNAANGNTLNKVAENNNVTFKGYRAYFSAKSGSTLAKTISLSFDELPTGTGTLIIDHLSLNDDAAIYDLSGRRIPLSMVNGQWSTLNKGIYIINGKKVLIK